MNTQTNPNPPLIREWKHMTGEEFAALDHSKTVVILTCSPMEVHGPHLPVLTDIQEGEALMRRTVELFSEDHPKVRFIRLPFFYVATDVVPQSGSIFFQPSTVVQVLKDLGRSLAKQGFRHIWLSNFHGGPRHFVSLEKACHWVNRRYKTRMVSIFSMMIGRLTGGTTDLSAVFKDVDGMTKEDLKEDMHGGMIETSLMLHLLKDQVQPGYSSLEKLTVDIKQEKDGKRPVNNGSMSPIALFHRFKANLKYYESETYCGNPAAATAEKGEKILEILAGLTSEVLAQLWKEELSLKECHSPLWKVRFILTNPAFGWLIERLIAFKGRVW